MFRFFVNQKQDNYFVLDQSTLHHLKVARLSNKSFICIYQSQFYECILQNNNQAQIIKQWDENHEFIQPVVIAVSLIKMKRFEWIIQKAAELGATKFIPMISTNVNIDHRDLAKKIMRWQTISQNACEQAFRNVVMEITMPQSLTEIITKAVDYFATSDFNRFIVHEKTASNVMISFPTNSIFLIGPEGGFTDQELQNAQAHNFLPINLGQRILRSETAALFVLSRVND